MFPVIVKSNFILGSSYNILIGNIWDKESVLQILLVDAAKAYPPDATETDYRQRKNTLEVMFIWLYRIFLAMIDW